MRVEEYFAHGAKVVTERFIPTYSSPISCRTFYHKDHKELRKGNKGIFFKETFVNERRAQSWGRRFSDQRNLPFLFLFLFLIFTTKHSKRGAKGHKGF